MIRSGPAPIDPDDVYMLALRHGLTLAGDLEFNEVGLDFRVGFATDAVGVPWVLRIPRRLDVMARAENEARVLRLVRGRLPVAVPEWRIVSPELIAYPCLPGPTAITVDPAGGEPTWHIDRQSDAFVTSFARVLVALHAIAPKDAAAAGLAVVTPVDLRRRFADDLDRVRRELGIGVDLERRWRSWLDQDDAWPPFTVLIHGDLHVGHVLVDCESRATGILDWTEAAVGDPAVDFQFHLMGFGDQGLDRLIDAYEAAGGRTWPGLHHHVGERLAAFPITFAMFALTTGQDSQLSAVRVQLGLAT